MKPRYVTRDLKGMPNIDACLYIFTAAHHSSNVYSTLLENREFSNMIMLLKHDLL